MEGVVSIGKLELASKKMCVVKGGPFHKNILKRI